MLGDTLRCVPMCEDGRFLSPSCPSEDCSVKSSFALVDSSPEGEIKLRAGRKNVIPSEGPSAAAGRVKVLDEGKNCDFKVKTERTSKGWDLVGYPTLLEVEMPEARNWFHVVSLFFFLVSYN